MQSDEKYIQLFKRSVANYYACITGVDEQFGRIIQALKKNGQYDNTIVVFVSDHGDSMGMHNNIGKNIFYEEAMRVPFLISYGKQLTPRMDQDLLISLEDFCLTVLSLMGFQQEIPATVQTRDLSEQIRGNREKMPSSQLYMFYGAVNETGKNLTTGARGVRTLQYTYAIRYKDGVITEEHLYDRKTDPFQLNNIAGKHPELVKQLRAELKQRMEAVHDPALSVL